MRARFLSTDPGKLAQLVVLIMVLVDMWVFGLREMHTRPWLTVSHTPITVPIRLTPVPQRLPAE